VTGAVATADTWSTSLVYDHGPEAKLAKVLTGKYDPRSVKRKKSRPDDVGSRRRNASRSKRGSMQNENVPG
jgi:hypothetical protein